MASSEIIVCGQRYDIEHRVATFDDEDGYSAYVPHRTDNIAEIYASDPAPGLKQRATRYRERRSLGAGKTLPRLRQVVRQVVVHLDGCRDAKMCFNVLHNQRGLSIHFMVDNDGTIYQPLDLLHCSFHAGGVNEISIGIELQNRGDAARYPHYYPPSEPREIVTCRVHGAQFLSYDFTPAQYEAMVRLCRALTRIFDIPLLSPHESGRPVWTTIDNPRGFRGFLGHYHLSINKWDPGPWDFQRLFRSIGSRATFPFSGLGAETKKGALEAESARYHDNADQDVAAHFPVGPLGESRLWHGGVHLLGREGQGVHAVLRGQIVAARTAPPCAVGSCSFVLLRHRLALGQTIWTVFTLYFHLGFESSEEQGIPWLARSQGQPWRTALERGETALLEVNVEAGEVIGTVGEAGPQGYRDEEIHFAVFSERELGQEVDPGYWEVLEGGGSRFCADRAFLARIDRPTGGQGPDGLLSRRELRNFFQFNPARKDLRRLAVHHLSEWTPGDWAGELGRAPDFAALSPAQRHRLITQQVTPTLWYTAEVARHAGLPLDGVVYSYHPIGFLVWLERMLHKHAGARGAGIDGADRWEGKLPPAHLTVDSESGNEMTDEEDFHSGEHSKKLTLEDLANGYPDD